MSLSTYHQKRHFNRTPEPRGKSVKPVKAGQLRFVIQKHDASRLHYDFRLEFEGVLKSWAVPKGPSVDPGKKSLAVQVEDHPIDYGDFEGVIPEGEYGGGTVLLWDTGTWQPLHDAGEGFKSGKLHFVLEGKKLQGEWSLVRMHGQAGGDGKNWLLMKVKDKYASTARDIQADEPQSVKTSRSLEQIAGARDQVWSRDAKDMSLLPGATRSAWPKALAPQLAVLTERPPEGDGWIHEIKYDGYRFVAMIKNGKVQLITRNGNDWTAKFKSVAKALEKLKVDSAILDGEMVVLDDEGRSDFQSLQALVKDHQTADPVYFVFDLPFCNGIDLRQTPLLERKDQLQKILENSKLAPLINFSEHVQGDGTAVVGKACEMALEGIVSKRADAPYVSRRDPSWVKSKCDHRQEFVVVGYTDPQGSRGGFGALLLGYYDQQKSLVYAGRVGTGFNDQLLKRTIRQLKQLEQKAPATDVDPPARERRNAHWVKATLVAEVKFTGWTREGVLRHPAFVAFRSDKPAAQVVREMPVKSVEVKAAARKGKQTVPVEKPSAAGITLTHPDKVFYPDSKTTKQQLVDYYLLVQQWMLPLVVDRPLALVRCPGGISGKCFFQRNWSDNMPDAIGKVDVGLGKKNESHVTIHDLAGLVSMPQMGVLEIHTWGCRVDAVEQPDQLIFDLDPGPDVSWKMVIKAARKLKSTLDDLQLPTFLKTSGGKGLHITVPIVPNIDWDSA